MSKESKSRDRFRQSIEAARDRPDDFCPGCGCHVIVTGEHRADCTTRPPACTVCLYHPNVHGHHRPDCPRKEH
jgi:hypothetical protein